MSNAQIRITVGNAKAFDDAVHGPDSLPECGDLQVITKDDGMVSHRACVCVTFTVDVDGKPRRAQAVTSVRALREVLKALDLRYEDGFVKQEVADAN